MTAKINVPNGGHKRLPEMDSSLKQALYRLKAHSNPNRGIPFIVTAAKIGDKEAIKALHKNGFDINQRTTGISSNTKRRTAIFYSVLNNDIETTELLLSLGAETNIRDGVFHHWYAGNDLFSEYERRTPLEYAASVTKNLKMVKLLVEKGKACILIEFNEKYLAKTSPEIATYLQKVIQKAKVKEKRKNKIATGKHPANQLQKPVHEMQ